jgi:hypothetical protein
MKVHKSLRTKIENPLKLYLFHNFVLFSIKHIKLNYMCFFSSGITRKLRLIIQKVCIELLIKELLPNNNINNFWNYIERICYLLIFNIPIIFIGKWTF